MIQIPRSGTHQPGVAPVAAGIRLALASMAGLKYETS